MKNPTNIADGRAEIRLAVALFNRGRSRTNASYTTGWLGRFELFVEKLKPFKRF